MIELTCGILIAISILLILEDDQIRNVFGIMLLSTTINLCILFCGRLEDIAPAFMHVQSNQAMSNPVTQALILTAIVIGFGLLSFLIILVKKQMAQAQ